MWLHILALYYWFSRKVAMSCMSGCIAISWASTLRRLGQSRQHFKQVQTGAASSEQSSIMASAHLGSAASLRPACRPASINSALSETGGGAKPFATGMQVAQQGSRRSRCEYLIPGVHSGVEPQN